MRSRGPAARRASSHFANLLDAQRLCQCGLRPEDVEVARQLLHLARGAGETALIPKVMRYFMLSSHYRGPINYSLEQLEQADSALVRLYGGCESCREFMKLQPGESYGTLLRGHG